ncbi:alpha/beta hydrolase [Streptomyces sp. NPDC093064]|uniref:alpha/beta hydrolase n=1 Tax=unclassified Streptomyces TaxID=2593676 RepID=UPI0036ADEF2D
MEVVRVPSLDGIELAVAVHRPDPDAGSLGTVVLVHGISADLDEGGAFVRLSDHLAAHGLTAVRFSFRGHGTSGGTAQGVTIAGEMLDLQAITEYAATEFRGPLGVVAASFGAVATALSMPWLGKELAGLVLWNPVLDLQRTFLEPELPWGVANFGPAAMARLAEDGRLLLNGTFALGRVLFAEMLRCRPLDAYTVGSPPTLVLHGDRDAHVSFDIARRAAETIPNWEFHAVSGAEHGFHTREHEAKAVAMTTGWLERAVAAGDLLHG